MSVLPSAVILGLAALAAWFLAIAGMFNGIAHPLLALASGGYFPGLVSSPFIAVMSNLALAPTAQGDPADGCAGLSMDPR